MNEVSVAFSKGSILTIFSKFYHKAINFTKVEIAATFITVIKIAIFEQVIIGPVINWELKVQYFK